MLKVHFCKERPDESRCAIKKLQQWGKKLLNEKYDLCWFIDIYYDRETQRRLERELSALVVELKGASDGVQITKLTTLIRLKKDELAALEWPRQHQTHSSHNHNNSCNTMLTVAYNNRNR